LINYKTFSLLQEIPYIFSRHNELVELSTNLFTSAIHNIYRQQGELAKDSGEVMFFTELYIQGLLKSRTLASLGSTANLVAEILQMYRKFPENLKLWIINRKEKLSKAHSLFKLISICTPSIAFGLQFFQCTLKEIYHESALIQVANNMFDSIVCLLGSFSVLRAEFYTSGFDRLLLSFPYSLHNKLVSNQIEQLKLDYTTHNLKAYDFKDTPDYMKYVDSLNYFVKTTHRLEHPDLQKFMIDSLTSFFENTLKNDKNCGNTLSLFFQGFKVLSNLTFQKDYATSNVCAVLCTDTFKSKIWSIMLCYIRVETKELSCSLTSKRLHLELLEFLQQLFECKSEIISNVVFDTQRKESVTIDNTSWLINMIYEASKTSRLKINESFTTLLESIFIPDTTNKNDINVLKPDSIFAELLVIRLRLFYFYSPKENIAFSNVLSTIITRTNGGILTMNRCVLANAITDVYNTWRSSDQTLLLEQALTDDLLFGDLNLNTLPKDSVFAYWKFFCKNDREQHLELKKNLKENDIVFDDVLCKTYCLIKLFYFLGQIA